MQPTEREMQGAASSISCFNGRSSRIMLQDAEEQQQKPIQGSDLRQVSSESQESSHEDFFDQILFNLPWTDLSYGNPKTAWDVNSPPVSQKLAVEFQLAGGEGIQFPQLYDESLLLASRLRQNQISGNGGGASDIQLDRYSQPQVLLPIPVSPGNVDSGDSRSLVDGSRNDVDSTFKSHGPLGGEGMYNGFGGSLHVKASHLPAANHQHINHTQTFNGGSGTAPPKQKVRARRGQATDPHSIAERLRRERIAERMKALQELVPNANKTDKASMLDEIIDYVKFLQLQVKVLSMSRLGGAAPFAADISPKGENEGMTAAEQQVAKLMEEDMGAAMQYLQGKGLCLMPISLASAISAATNSTISDLSLSSANNHAS